MSQIGVRATGSRRHARRKSLCRRRSSTTGDAGAATVATTASRRVARSSRARADSSNSSVPIFGCDGSRSTGSPNARSASLQVGPIDGRAGWLVRNKLVDRLGESGSGDPAYRLDVTLDDNITAFGIRRDQAATRERRTLRARYQLVSLATGLVVLDATAGSDAGIDIVSSEYATVAAEQTALEHLADMLADQITARVALYASRSAPAQ